MSLKKLFEEDREFNQGAPFTVSPLEGDTSSGCSAAVKPDARHDYGLSVGILWLQGVQKAKQGTLKAKLVVHTGDFAEATRDQFMQERQEHLAALEQAILDATLQSPDCTRDQLAHALMAMDSELPQAQVCHSSA